MITYINNGPNLRDSKGNVTSPTQGAAYSNMLDVMDKQFAASLTNTQAVNNYDNLLSGVNTSILAGRPAVAPPKPLQVIVDDNGNTTFVPFDPPLADPVPTPVITGSTVSGPPIAPTVDIQAIMYSMILAIYRKMFP